MALLEPFSWTRESRGLGAERPKKEIESMGCLEGKEQEMGWESSQLDGHLIN